MTAPGVAEQGLGPGEPAVAGAERVPDLLLAGPAVAADLRRLRRGVREWLAALDWPAEDADLVVLAVHEAASNAAEHAYRPDAPGPLTVYGWVVAEPLTGGRRVVVTVTDQGMWRDGGHHTRAALGGLVVMAGCTAGLHVQRSPGGTSVLLRSRLVTDRPR